ncbi:NAD(P)-dependent oxidoreductase [Kribbella sp. NPDC004536]|uniref:NAD(P)-dependent oxidoreductase n=1 Tax=Kribbella sp. NPDC004536 TaxID=3364106 RepID=UPI0036CA75F6
MSKILVIGARGRAGSAAVAEARGRGHDVTGVARTAGDSLVVGDVTDAERIGELAAGYDAVIAGVYDGGSDPAAFFPRAARALVDGLATAGVRRLVWVGLASVVPTTAGPLVLDAYPEEYHSLFFAHRAALDVFVGSPLDWVSIAPSGDFDHADPSRKGPYRVAPPDARALISYADFAVALVDEVDHPSRHREAFGVLV